MYDQSFSGKLDKILVVAKIFQGPFEVVAQYGFAYRSQVIFLGKCLRFQECAFEQAAKTFF